MGYKLIYNENKVYDEYLENLYEKNYSHDLEYPPEHRYEIVLNWQDYWFHLVNSNDEIIASCSVNKNQDGTYEIFDVFVEEKFRGNNYAVLLLMNVLYHFGESKTSFKITTDVNNIPAIKSYKKVFGKPVQIDEENVYFILSM